MRREGFIFLGVMIFMVLMSTILVSLSKVHLIEAKRMREEELSFNLIQIRRALDDYYYLEKEFPKDLDTLIRDGLLRREYRDPNNIRENRWDRTWEYQRSDGSIRSRSGEVSLGGVPYRLWTPTLSGDKYIIDEAGDEI